MEGPSLVILKEDAAKFIGKTVIHASGEANVDMERVTGQKIKALQTWGKHFLILFDDFIIRVHFLMFGNYYLDAKHPEKKPKLALEFENGEWNFYTCAAKIIDKDTPYDFTTDVMSDSWSPAGAKRKLKAQPQMLVCDALMDQAIFSGVGNIIKNEVLYRIGVHPESEVGALPAAKLNALIAEARHYSFDFYHWKRAGTLRQHWQVFTKKICPCSALPLQKKHTGINARRSFFCTSCQKLYTSANKKV